MGVVAAESSGPIWADRTAGASNARDREGGRHATGRPLPAQTVNLARIKEFRDRGDPLLVGTFGERQAEGSMAVFGSREGVEEGRGDDRFVNEVWCSLDAAGVGRGRERDLSGL